MVKPSYADWRAEPLAQHRAKAVVGFANDMAERMFHFLGLQEKYGSGGAGQYRNTLAEQCPDFGLLRDVADGTKHYRLSRPTRKISGADQTNIEALTWDRLEDTWADAEYLWNETEAIIVVTLDNDEQRTLISIVNNVMTMWERLLNDLT